MGFPPFSMQFPAQNLPKLIKQIGNLPPTGRQLNGL